MSSGHPETQLLPALPHHSQQKPGEKSHERKWSGGPGRGMGALPPCCSGLRSAMWLLPVGLVWQDVRAWNPQEVPTAPMATSSCGYQSSLHPAGRAEMVLKHWTGKYVSKCCIKQVAGPGRWQASEQTQPPPHTHRCQSHTAKNCHKDFRRICPVTQKRWPIWIKDLKCSFRLTHKIAS